MWVHPEKNIDSLKIDLGSGNPEEGEIRPEGYVLNDIEAHQGIDLVCDIMDLEQFIKPEQCQEIRISHVLEHFGKADVLKIVRMANKLLKMGGSFSISVPNFIWHMQLLSEGKEEDAVLYAFGGQRDQFDYHKTGFTPQILSNLLTSNGFFFKEMLAGSSIGVVSTKVANLRT
jgi:predicted SAM-dependent methyltransferase